MTRRRIALILLLSALCSFSTRRAARAENPPQGETELDPADENADGTVSKREKRRYRRKLRRANRQARDGSSSSADDADDSDDDADDSATSDAAQAKQSAALSKAAGAASAMASAAQGAESAAAMAGGASQAAAASPQAAKAGPSAPSASAAPPPASPKAGGPSNPQGPQDFLLAARSGYVPAFAKAGLKLGADGRTIVRLDGSPATSADLANLRREIMAMPGALVRRPDFFSAITQDHYAAVKAGYKAHPELSDSVYKHVGTTEDQRDLVHTASCVKLSGECNANVEKASYKKGEFVDPEDLDRMYKDLERRLDEEESEDGARPLGSGLGGFARAADAGASAELPSAGAAAAAAAPAPGAASASASSSATPAQTLAAAKTTAKRLVFSAAAAFGLPKTAAGAALPLAAAAGLALLGLAALVLLRRR